MPQPPSMSDSLDRVLRILQSNSIAFTVHRHADLDPTIKSPQDFAAALGYDLRRVTKTLFVRSTRRNQSAMTGEPVTHKAMVVAPITCKVDMRKIASHLGCSRVEIASPAELQEQLGFVHGSVSPVVAVPIPVLMEESLLAAPTILIGSGQKAVEIELSPQALRGLTGAHTFSFAHEEPARNQ